jgi:hypothetical protein
MPTRRIALVGIVLGLLTTMSPLNQAPAHAASSVSFCFQWSTGSAYASQPVYLMAWNSRSQKWDRQIRNGRTNSAGCGTFSNTPTNEYLIVQGYVVLWNGQMWSGYTPRYANPGAGAANLGRGTVSYIRNV